MKKLKTLIALITILIILIAVLIISKNTWLSNEPKSDKTTDATTEQTESNSEISILDNEEELLFNLEGFINGNDVESSGLFSDDISIAQSDIDVDTGLYEKKLYKSNSAIYLQIKDYMFRFQLNSNNKIESYIKYELGA